MRVKSFKNSKIAMEAYHGTVRKTADSIGVNGFDISKGIDHWLGEGVYFFREDQSQAKFYADRARRRIREELENLGQHDEAKKPEYKSCIIQWCDQLEKEEFLNLDNRSDAIFFDRHLKLTKKMLDSRGYDVEGALWEFNNEVFKLLPSHYTVIQRTFPVPSGKYGNHEDTLFNTLMFFPILKGNRDVSAEIESIRTELIHGTQIVVRNPDRVSLDKLSWVAC